MNLLALIDQAVADGFASHGDYLSPYGKEGGRAHRMIVRKVAKALRDSLSAPKDDEGEASRTADPEPQSQYWQCEVWSKEWWALFFAQIHKGKSVAFFLDHAVRSEKGAIATVAPDQQPPAELIERMHSYPSDGEAARLWRPWLARKGIRLPDWRGRMWIFLPAPEPPEESAA